MTQHRHPALWGEKGAGVESTERNATPAHCTGSKLTLYTVIHSQNGSCCIESLQAARNWLGK